MAAGRDRVYYTVPKFNPQGNDQGWGNVAYGKQGSGYQHPQQGNMPHAQVYGQQQQQFFDGVNPIGGRGYGSGWGFNLGYGGSGNSNRGGFRPWGHGRGRGRQIVGRG